jgi:hypothetical protein
VLHVVEGKIHGKGYMVDLAKRICRREMINKLTVSVN